MSLFLVVGQGADTAGDVSAFNNTEPTPWILRSLTESLLKVCPVSLPMDSLLETEPMGLRRMSSQEECWVGIPQSEDWGLLDPVESRSPPSSQSPLEEA